VLGLKIISMKATAVAPSNIAFIKYWGKKDEILRLPLNGSLSVNLSNQFTTTTVEFSPNYKDNSFLLNGKELEDNQRIFKHIDYIKKRSNVTEKAKIVSINNFPTASGLASSASGYAALTLAAVNALGLTLSEKELSVFARIGSGSACRSIPDGFVEWIEGDVNNPSSSYAISLFPENHWNISIITLLVEADKKEISSTSGHRLALENPFLRTRLEQINNKIKQAKEYIKAKDFMSFGKLIESEAIEMHAIALTSSPPILYWNGATISLMKTIWHFRKKGINAYFTIDAGPHLHVIVQKKDEQILINELNKVAEVKKLILNYPAKGARIKDNHLF